MDMAILLHDGLYWTYPTSICHVHPHDTTRLAGVAAFQAVSAAQSWFRQSGVIPSRPPAGNANRWAVDGMKIFEGVQSMQQTTLKILLLSMMGVFISACGENLFARPTATLTFTSTPISQPTDTSTAAPLPTGTPIPSSSTPEYFADKNGFEMMLISAGEFLMGNNSIGGKRPEHIVYLDDYYIDTDVVNNTDFVQFLNENLKDISVEIRDGMIIHDTPSQTEGIEIYGKAVYLREDLIYCIDCFGWDSNLPSQDDWNKSIIWDGQLFSILAGREDFPVTMVNWYGAQAYCSWRQAHLPTEAEWVKAYNKGMERNDLVSEWVFDWFAEDYYSRSPYKNPQGPETGTFRLIIGSDLYRDYMSPDFGYWDLSFRCSRASLD